MAPFVRREFLSAITRYEPPHFLEEDFEGAGMRGHLAYEFVSDAGGTHLIQRETLDVLGPLKIFSVPYSVDARSATEEAARRNQGRSRLGLERRLVG